MLAFYALLLLLWLLLYALSCLITEAGLYASLALGTYAIGRFAGAFVHLSRLEPTPTYINV